MQNKNTKNGEALCSGKDTIIISDIHIGSKNSKTRKLYDFLNILRKHPPRKVIIAGDLFELWSTNYASIGKYEYKVIRKLIELSQNGVKIIYIPGNHDRAFRAFRKFSLGKIKIRREYILRTNRKKYVILHGDEFDAFTRNYVIVSLILDKAYAYLVKFNSFFKRFFGFRVSLSARKKSKKYINVVRKIKRAALVYASSLGLDGVIIGHTHWPEIYEDLNGIVYVNSGDWIDNYSYVVVGENIRLEFFQK